MPLKANNFLKQHGPFLLFAGLIPKRRFNSQMQHRRIIARLVAFLSYTPNALARRVTSLENLTIG